MAITTEITVRYAETDCMGIVHHSVYPVWYEVARTEYIKALGMSYSDMEKNGVMLPLASISCNYRRPAHYDEVLEVTARITRLSAARLDFHYTVRKKGEADILAEGTSCHGFVSAETFRPINFRHAMPELYEQMKQQADADAALQA